mgnify:CR=1 FL=1
MLGNDSKKCGCLAQGAPISAENASTILGASMEQFSRSRQEILADMEERKVRYKADQMALQREMRELRKSYHQSNAEFNRQLKALKTSYPGNPKKECFALNRHIGQLLLAFDSQALNTAHGVSTFDLQEDKAVFTISINIVKEG